MTLWVIDVNVDGGNSAAEEFFAASYFFVIVFCHHLFWGRRIQENIQTDFATFNVCFWNKSAFTGYSVVLENPGKFRSRKKLEKCPGKLKNERKVLGKSWNFEKCCIVLDYKTFNLVTSFEWSCYKVTYWEYLQDFIVLGIKG